MAMKKRKKNKRKIEVFIAGCPVCYDAIDLVNRLAGPDDEVTILDMTRSRSRRQGKGTRYSLYPLCGD